MVGRGGARAASCSAGGSRSRTPSPTICPGAGPLGVVLVHGFVCNRGFWNPWLRRFREAGVPFVAVNLEPVFGRIGDYVGIVDAAVARAREATGRAPLVVAHSMGGLGGAGLARAVPVPGSRSSMWSPSGSPHHGTWLARFGITPNGLQVMRRANDWLDALQEKRSRRRANHPGRFTCFLQPLRQHRVPAVDGHAAGVTTAMCPAARTCTAARSRRCSRRSGRGSRQRSAKPRLVPQHAAADLVELDARTARGSCLRRSPRRLALVELEENRPDHRSARKICSSTVWRAPGCVAPSIRMRRPVRRAARRGWAGLVDRVVVGPDGVLEGDAGLFMPSTVP